MVVFRIVRVRITFTTANFTMRIDYFQIKFKVLIIKRVPA